MEQIKQFKSNRIGIQHVQYRIQDMFKFFKATYKMEHPMFHHLNQTQVSIFMTKQIISLIQTEITDHHVSLTFINCTRKLKIEHSKPAVRLGRQLEAHRFGRCFEKVRLGT